VVGEASCGVSVRNSAFVPAEVPGSLPWASWRLLPAVARGGYEGGDGLAGRWRRRSTRPLPTVPAEVPGSLPWASWRLLPAVARGDMKAGTG